MEKEETLQEETLIEVLRAQWNSLVKMIFTIFL